ncbi:MAG: hypothetical protein COA42_15160 [Alteromonadaceae bacterium]|nr:MAG: hypothetical protein COA42_15160 [Alteromonadaceae bacterium]
MRIDELKANGGQEKTLMPFVGNPREPMPHGLPFHLQDYIELVVRSCAPAPAVFVHPCTSMVGANNAGG